MANKKLDPVIKKAFETVFKDLGNLYHMFHKSPEGQSAWNHAYKKFPKFNYGGSHTDKACDYILDEMKDFYHIKMREHNPDQDEDVVDDWWWEHLHDPLSEEVMAGLT